MERALKHAPRVAIFLAGVAAGVLTGPLVRNARTARREQPGGDPASTEELKRSLAGLEKRLAAQESAHAARLAQIEDRLDEHAAQLAEVPSTAQIVAAMEQLLCKSMASLDERLSTQAHSIEIFKSTISQTDSLLQRVLESLGSLQTYTDPLKLSQDAVLQRPTV